MSPEFIGVLGLVVLVGMILVKIPIGISLITVSFVGTWVVVGERVAWGMLGVIPRGLASDWALSSIPMFIFMGYLAFHGNLTSGLFRAARVWLNNVPGGLSIAGIFGALGFSAVTGSSVACSAAMGRIAVPEMLKAGYNVRLATGSVAAAGTIGALIPPSILMIIYGIIANVSITDLFIGGIIPGIMTFVGYSLVVMIIAIINPKSAPKIDEHVSWGLRFESLKEVLPTLLIIVFVFGGLFAGAFTPTQAGAVGASFAMLLGVIKRSLSLRDIWTALRETIEVSASLFIIIIGANLLARFLAFSGAGDLLSEMIYTSVSNKYLLLLGIVLIYLVLGMFLEPLGAMLLTLPILLPVLEATNMDLLWFGILLVKLLEIGMITPPVGMNVFVLQAVVGKDAPLGQIFRGVIPFIMSDFVVTLIMILVPATALFLPGLLD